jgi:hypothetical protein
VRHAPKIQVIRRFGMRRVLICRNRVAHSDRARAGSGRNPKRALQRTT